MDQRRLPREEPGVIPALGAWSHPRSVVRPQGSPPHLPGMQQETMEHNEKSSCLLKGWFSQNQCP